MILLIDNYDSFSYNLYQMLGGVREDILVIRNDQMTVEEIDALNPSAIVLSPGPGHPVNAGIIEQAASYFAGRRPVLGVCLGHQAICEAFGGTVGYAQRLMHGKQSDIRVDRDCPLFFGLPEVIRGGRYHSLAAQESSLPAQLQVVARADDGEVMAVRHVRYPVYGLQFHPESILTPDGQAILENFLGRCCA